MHSSIDFSDVCTCNYIFLFLVLFMIQLYGGVHLHMNIKVCNMCCVKKEKSRMDIA